MKNMYEIIFDLGEAILDLYMRTEFPSTSLLDLAKFFVVVYSKTFFEIKWWPNYLNEAKQLLNMIIKVR